MIQRKEQREENRKQVKTTQVRPFVFYNKARGRQGRKSPRKERSESVGGCLSSVMGMAQSGEKQRQRRVIIIHNKPRLHELESREGCAQVDTRARPCWVSFCLFLLPLSCISELCFRFEALLCGLVNCAVHLDERIGERAHILFQPWINSSLTFGMI